MRKRGRKSSAELSVTPVSTDARRPAPPAELTEHQARIWQDIVKTEPGGWFRPAEEPLLVAFCRHVHAANLIAKMVDAFDVRNRDPDQLDRLLRMHERETRAMSSLATRMRFTQQARMHPRTAARAEIGPGSHRKLWDRRPWEDG